MPDSTLPSPRRLEPPAPPRRNSALVGAAALTLLALPFLFLGPWLLDGKALVELRCEPRGPCVLTRSGWLTTDEVARFGVAELKGAHVQRGRNSRAAGNSIYRANVETRSGTFPLAHQWVDDAAAGPEQDVARVKAFLQAPEQGLHLRRDDRRVFARVGGAFTAVGALVLLGALFLLVRGLRAQRRR
jgi:hypothetical protein